MRDDAPGTVGLLRVTLLIRTSHSLKEKRNVLNRVRDGLRRDFNISIAEVDSQDAWQRADLAIAAAGTDPGFVRERLEEVLSRIRTFHDAGVVDHAIEIH